MLSARATRSCSFNEMALEGGALESDDALDPDHIRGDLQEMLDRKVRAFDEFRADAVADWHGQGRRTPRENIADLVDDDTFKEFGPLVAQANRRRPDHGGRQRQR